MPVDWNEYLEMSPKDLLDTASRRLEPIAESVYLRFVGRAVMVAVVPVGIFLWGYQLSTSRDMQKEANDQAVAIGRLTVLTEQLREDVNNRSSDRYTGAQAARDWREQHDRDQRQDSRIDLLENRLHNLEVSDRNHR